METILFIYLAGFFTTTGYVLGDCSQVGCHVMAPVAGLIWPVSVGASIFEEVSK